MSNHNYMEAVIPKDSTPEHYYGDVVRKLFIVSAVGMALALPIFNNLIWWPLFISIIAIVVLAFLGGIQNPRQRWVIFVNAATAAIGAMIFEYNAVDYYLRVPSLLEPFFWANQALAIIFLVAVYYSSKTLRGKVVNKPLV